VMGSEENEVEEEEVGRDFGKDERVEEDEVE
jgi:hypothetical protein